MRHPRQSVALYRSILCGLGHVGSALNGLGHVHVRCWQQLMRIGCGVVRPMAAVLNGSGCCQPTKAAWSVDAQWRALHGVGVLPNAQRQQASTSWHGHATGNSIGSAETCASDHVCVCVSRRSLWLGISWPLRRLMQVEREETVGVGRWVDGG